MIQSQHQTARLEDAQQLEVLALVCASLKDVHAMCSALCSSSAARQAILAKCSRRLPLDISSRVGHGTAAAAWKRLAAQTAWLAQHAALVGNLSIFASGELEGDDELAMQPALRPPLQLRHLTLSVSRPGALLKQLDPSRLTSLQFNVDSALQQPNMPLAVAALGLLTGLQQLSFEVGGTTSFEQLPASLTTALAGMQHLTQLVLQPQLPAAALLQLPSRLIQLQLTNPDCEAAQLVTALKALKQLQSLTLVYRMDPDAEAEQVSRQTIDSHASAAWAAIPVLRQLDLILEDPQSGDGKLSAGLAGGIAGATTLTRLYCGFDGGCQPGVNMLAILSRLQQLESLDLHAVAEGAVVSSFGALFSQQLTKLKSLTLDIGSVRGLAIAQLGFEAKHLTQLVLVGAALDDDSLDILVHGMTQLRQLALCHCQVTPDSLVAALAPPRLPLLEQLAYIVLDVEDAVPLSFTDMMQQNRSHGTGLLQVVIGDDRRCIECGFVGEPSVNW